MILIQFAIYDQKAAAFITPFYCPTVGLAERMFSEAANSVDHNFHKHAADFTLFEIGTFEQDSAAVCTHPAPLNRGNALTFIKSPMHTAVPNGDLADASAAAITELRKVND